MNARDILYILCGYLSGSILFAKIFGRLLCGADVAEKSEDKNPGTANAFKYGGFLCGVLTLVGDIIKGILPVHMYISGQKDDEYGLALAFVIAAPVIGHILPVFFRFRGGKAIAVFFGSLLGLFPVFMMPGFILAAAFIFFSVIVKISPHYYRTIAAYGASVVGVFLFGQAPLAVSVGFLISAVAITLKLLRSTEEKESLEVKLAWKH